MEISYKMKMLISEMLSLSASRRPTCSHIKERLLSSRPETRQPELLLGVEMKEVKEVKEQKKIAGCVFFL